ncbi:MAG: bis(5'-nucleosyl)-tetraphosphatase (symmetrical) YqeK [Lachnospiraceae bacterium]|jgi:predicted HD superfamily hydrolase involved in NAD metabolism
MNSNILYIRQKLKNKLDEDRYEHTLGVAYTAVCLAMRYGEDLYKAEIAGLLHDCAKCIPDDIKIKKCRKYNIGITASELANPSLLHAKLGAYYAMNKYGVRDMDVINAILCHTTGKPSMTTFEKIIFVADYIEPRRDKAQDLPEVRRMAFVDLDKTVYTILKDTLDYLKKRGGPIDPMTEKTCRYYEEELYGGESGREPDADSADTAGQK